MANKITKREMFELIKGVEGVADNADMVAFINHEIELLDKKHNSKKATKTQVENEGIKAEILASLTSEGVTISELQAKSEVLGSLSNQKITALMRQLVDSGLAIKTIEKRKSYFSIA